MSGTTAMRYFKCVDFKATELPEVLSLDEFKGNSGGNKYNSIVADPQNHKVVDILPNRYENDLIQYFSHFESKKDVKYFVCDMNPHFREVAKTCFKNAVSLRIASMWFARPSGRWNESGRMSRTSSLRDSENTSKNQSLFS